jgi:hypothetical protein
VSYIPKVYHAQGGDRLVVESGGTVHIKTGGQIVGDAGTQVSAIPELAGTVGTANDIMTQIAAPTDSPATADALRDDIAANLVPAVNNNFADLQVKVNSILSALRALGAIAS